MVRHRQFSERLNEPMAKYHNGMVDTVQIIMELIQIGKDLREEPKDNLSSAERAFYDALAENESAGEVMGNEELRVIAAELVRDIRSNASVDRWKFEQRRTQIRVMVRRILRTHGYPPDLQAAAIKTVLEQAEALAAEVAGRGAPSPRQVCDGELVAQRDTTLVPFPAFRCVLASQGRSAQKAHLTGICCTF